jgi:hypothetical protein
MMIVQPDGTLIRATLLCLLAGVGWGMLATLIVYVGSTRIEPRVHPSRIWADWRLHRMIWALGVIIPTCAVMLSSDWLFREVGMKDLYWVGRRADLLLMCRLAGVTGYLLMLLIVVVVPLLKRRRSEAKDKAPRQ